MLSKRLKTVVDAVGSAACVLDMGCDHGYVPLAFIRNGQADKVIASDISAPSLQKTADKVRSARLNDRIETRLGDGLDVIAADECDAVIMAGMGGLLLSEILKKDAAKVKNARLVLQPMNHAAAVRLTLEKIGFRITDEQIVSEDGHDYQIITAEPGAMRVKDPIDYWVGYASARRGGAVFDDFVRAMIASEEKIAAHLENNATENAKRRRAQGIGFIAMLKEVLS